VSLINQMLRDLDARDPEKAHLSAVETPAPVPIAVAKPKRGKLGFITLLIVSVVLIGWLSFPQIQRWANQIVFVKDADSSKSSKVHLPIAKDNVDRPTELAPINNEQKQSTAKTPLVKPANLGQVRRSTAKATSSNSADTLPSPQIQTVNGQASPQSSQVDSIKITGSASKKAEVVSALPTLAVKPPVDNPVPGVVVELPQKSTSKPSPAKKIVTTDGNTKAPPLKAQPTKVKDTQVNAKSSHENLKRLKTPTQKIPKEEKAKKITPVKRVSKPIDRVAHQFSRAKKALTAGQYSESEALLIQTLKLNAKHRDARQLLAKLQMRSGATNLALNTIDQGLFLNPNDSKLLVLKARIAMQNGGVARARALLESGLKRNQNDLPLLTMMGVLLQQDKDFKEAVGIYQRLVSLQPSDGKSWAGLAMSYDAIQQNQQALEAYKKAMALGRLPPQVQQYAQQRKGVLENKR